MSHSLPKLPLLLLLLAATAASDAHAQQTRSARKAARAAGSTTAAVPAPSVAGGPAGAPQLPPPPPGGPGHKPGRPAPPAVQELSDFSGTLTQYVATNDEQIVDGFVLNTGSATDTVRLPRHAAQQLMAAAKAGSRVTVNGYRHTGPDGRAALHMVSLTAGGQTIKPTPPTPSATPPTEASTTVKGTVSSLRKDREGRVNGLILNDQTIVRVPPHAAEQLSAKLRTGATIEATGYLHTPRTGEVALRPVRSLRAETLTLDGVRFLLR
ncbi:hypothetical protein ACFPAF_09620 [Hymenobacter endophyticus]|uniref:DUF5666 domain-containing protein n=1 Tax=Hymenobacter endophyticus TaxID=3076335 RepID=A0ABU3TGZ7_9BACT|nr:hypothetical protein [Hymenobacter endophyticus]MDU0370649.1 hypothetical protein [Hymenobacter endophyticus]